MDWTPEINSGLEIRVYFETSKTLGIRMSKHSPAPWKRCGQKDDPCGSAIIRAANGFEVANSRSFLIEEYEANANLIAAAPEMLEALRDAVRLIEYLGGNASHQKKTIAKAESCDESTTQSCDISFEHVVGLIVMAGDTASTYGPQQISIPEQTITVRR